MMDCQELERNLYAYLDGELEPAQREVAARHLESCERCRDSARDETQIATLVRTRLRDREPAPAALRTAILQGIRVSAGDVRVPWTVRLLGSPWAPRLAMAAVLAVLIAVPMQHFLRRTPALAVAAAERHGCHGAAIGGPLPPCCLALQARVGDRLGEPSPGAVVPDLRAAGLAFAGATRCNFGARVVNMLVYTDAAGGRFSLYTSDHDTREFKLLRTRTANGVPQVRHAVRIDDDAHGVHDDFEVAIWQHGNMVYTWVGPVASPAYEDALASLQQSR